MKIYFVVLLVALSFLSSPFQTTSNIITKPNIQFQNKNEKYLHNLASIEAKKINMQSTVELIQLGHMDEKQSPIVQFEVVQPEVSEPEAVQPEVSEPEAVQPEVSEPEVVQPEVSEPEAVQPEVSEPEAVQPEVSEPEVVQPEVSEPEVEQPEVEQPEVEQPEVEQPEVEQPEVEQPEVIRIVNVNHRVETKKGSNVFVVVKKSTFEAAVGTLVRGSSYKKNFTGTTFSHSDPAEITIIDGAMTINLYYTQNN